MGGRSQRPNPADYEAGPVEKMNAAIAKRSNEYFTTKLQPLIKQQIEDASEFQMEETVRGFANANTQQALNNQLDYNISQDFQASANKTLGSVSALVDANTAALDAKRKEEFAALNTGAGNQRLAAGALSAAAKGETSTGLQDAQSDLLVRKAKADAKFKIAQAGIRAATGNLASFNAVKDAGMDPGNFNPFMRYDTGPKDSGNEGKLITRFLGFGPTNISTPPKLG